MHGAGFILIGLLLSGAVAAAEPEPIAVFDFELIDTSLQGELQGTSQAELDRLELITEIVRDRLGASGRYRVVDTAPAADEIARAANLRTCNGCDLEVAAGLGAETVLIGWVQKVSNLILNINAVVRDVATGRPRAGGSVDIPGQYRRILDTRRRIPARQSDPRRVVAVWRRGSRECGRRRLGRAGGCS